MCTYSSYYIFYTGWIFQSITSEPVFHFSTDIMTLVLVTGQTPQTNNFFFKISLYNLSYNLLVCNRAGTKHYFHYWLILIVRVKGYMFAMIFNLQYINQHHMSTFEKLRKFVKQWISYQNSCTSFSLNWLPLINCYIISFIYLTIYGAKEDTRFDRLSSIFTCVHIYSFFFTSHHTKDRSEANKWASIKKDTLSHVSYLCLAPSVTQTAAFASDCHKYHFHLVFMNYLTDCCW